MQVAIDGLAGSGKSFLGKQLAKKLNYKFLSTGKLYRSLAFKFIQQNLDIDDEQSMNDFFQLKQLDEDVVEKFLSNTELGIVFDETGVGKILLDGTVIQEQFLESEIVSSVTRKISQNPSIRASVLDVQRCVAKENDIVMEGRDIGSVVLPNADVKFFITAPDDLRYERIYMRECESGCQANAENVKQSTKERDLADQTRKISPVVKPEGSIEIKNAGNLEVVDFLVHSMGLVVNKAQQRSEIIKHFSAINENTKSEEMIK